MSSNSATIYVTTPDGVEHELEASFTVESFGTADGWQEPGDPPEISIERIVRTEADGQTETDVTDWANKTFHSWNVQSERRIAFQYERDKITEIRRILFGRTWASDKLLPTVEYFTTSPETVAEYVERTILESLDDYLPDPDPGY